MMAYQDGFVVSILRNGHPVRETRGDNGMRTCMIPFGTEYKIRIKNSSTDYVKACVYIDDTPVLAGDKTFLIEPRSHVHLERFVEDLKEGNRFKFVELGNADVQDPTNRRNGIIRVVLQPCRRIIEPIVKTVVATNDCWNHSMYAQGMPIGETVCVNYCATPRSFDMGQAQASLGVTRSFTKGVAGATVEGSRSDQRFVQSHDKFENWGIPTTIEIQLRGMPDSYEEQYRREYECEHPSVGWTKPWRVVGRDVYYDGRRLEGVGHVHVNNQGGIVLYIERGAVVR